MAMSQEHLNEQSFTRTMPINDTNEHKQCNSKSSKMNDEDDLYFDLCLPRRRESALSFMSEVSFENFDDDDSWVSFNDSDEAFDEECLQRCMRAMLAKIEGDRIQDHKTTRKLAPKRQNLSLPREQCRLEQMEPNESGRFVLRKTRQTNFRKERGALAAKRAEDIRRCADELVNTMRNHVLEEHE